jgi:hypothetical protein
MVIEFHRTGVIDELLASLFSRLVNLNIYTQDFYERKLSSFFHVWQIRYILIPEK